MDTDTQTLDLLQRSLHSPGPDLRPTAGELHAFERAVRLAFAVPSGSRWPGSRHRTAIAVFGAIALGATSTVMALQSGAALPRPVRAVVFAAGLPVDSPALADARHALSVLEAATLAGDDLGRIANAAANLRERLTDLDGGERAKIDERATAALQEADRLLSPTTNEPAPATTGVDSPSAAPGSGNRPAAPDSGEQPSAADPDDSDGAPSPNRSPSPGDSSGPGSDGTDELDPSGSDSEPEPEPDADDD